ncbi:HPr kinase/phosphorylase [uncultured Roseobacter sp.]|uniref:HPr kinase/phosphorylase n=1 Tax=uncultured Roseobacter sp. TaxID=114847 RepID=UPI0026382595|nr:HPr kinase/phosphatase C-terminal domain-containing protein [uncultured Roseobacter sp.]
MSAPPPGSTGDTQILHASAVAVEGRSALITGASGSGKSALALQLLAYGARLIADDRTALTARDGDLIASCPGNIRGLIEARGLGILQSETIVSAPVAFVVDLDRVTGQRLPEPEFVTICGVRLRCIHKVGAGYFPAAVLQYLRGGMREPQ